jgi:hypothetical protein
MLLANGSTSTKLSQWGMPSRQQRRVSLTAPLFHC